MHEVRSAMLAVSFCVLLSACGNDQSLSEKAGSAVSGAATDFVSGLGAGVDKKMQVKVAADASLASHGLEATMSKASGIGLNESNVYVIAEKAFSGTLQAKALDAGGQEIGRAKVDVEFAADDAKYVMFAFDKAMDSQLVDKYVISVR